MWHRVPPWFVLEHSRKRVRKRFTGEWLPACQHFIEDDSEGPNVCPLVHGFAAGLLRTDICGGAENHPGLCGHRTDRWRIVHVDCRCATQFCKSEIEDLHGAIRFDLDVSGFQISMDDSFFVCRCESGDNLA